MVNKMGEQSAMGICAFFYMWHWYSVYWCSRDVWSIVGGYICHWYMCILLYVKLIWCIGVPEIYGQLGVYGVHLPWVYVHCSICDTTSNWWWVTSRDGGDEFVVMSKSELGNWEIRRPSPANWPQMYRALLHQTSITYWEMRRPSPTYQAHEHMNTQSGVVVFHRSGQLGGTSAMGICTFFYMWNLFGVVVFQRSMVDWWGRSASRSWPLHLPI